MQVNLHNFGRFFNYAHYTFRGPKWQAQNVRAQVVRIRTAILDHGAL